MTKLPTAILLAAVAAPAAAQPALENAAEAATTVFVVGSMFGFCAIIVAIVAYAAHRNRQLKHETIRLALEKGAPLAPELLDDSGRDRERAPTKDLRRGLHLLAVAIGLALFFWFEDGPEGKWAVGFIPGLLGVGYLATWLLCGRRAARAEEPPRG